MTRRPVLGIDLGTTYSCVASLDENQRASVLPTLQAKISGLIPEEVKRSPLPALTR